MAVQRVHPAVAVAASLFLSFSASQAQHVKYSSEHRESEHSVPQTINGANARLRMSLETSRTAVSVVAGDFDEDGTRDLISGYSTAAGGALLVQRGNPRAIAPSSVEWNMMAAGQFVVPYATNSEAIALPVVPNLLVNSDLSGQGHQDLFVAATGGSTLYLLHGKGDGGFSAPQAMPLAGTVTAIASWGSPSGDNLLVAAVCGTSGCGLQFLDHNGATKGFVKTPAAVTAIQAGSINLGRQLDLALIAGDQVLVLDGDSALRTRPRLETLPVTGAAALALGTFVPDHHKDLQIAVLGLNATLHVITRAGIDASYDPAGHRALAQSRYETLVQGKPAPALKPQVKRTGQPWIEAETVFNVGPGGSALMLRARLSGVGNDDLAVMAGSQYVTVAHPVERGANLFTTAPVVTVDSTSAPVTAAVAARVSPDARVSIITLGPGVHPLTLTVPTAFRTIYVNTTSDSSPTTTTINNCKSGSGSCSLRDAVTTANLDRASTTTAKVDTIMIPAGTYTLSANNIDSGYTVQATDFEGSVNHHLEMDAGMNLVGPGCTLSGTPSVPTACSVVINANQVDQAIAIGAGTFYATSLTDYQPASFDIFLTNLTIENGKNVNDPSSTLCQQTSYCNYFGGNMQYTVYGASNLVMTHVLVTGGASPYEGGGGLSAYEDTTGSGLPGPLEIDNSSFTFNSQTSTTTAEGGGGIVIENNPIPSVPLILGSDNFSNNTAVSSGGGVNVVVDNSQVTITNSVFHNNTSGNNTISYGGGGLYLQAPVTMTGSTVYSNSAYSYGGGIYLYGGSFAQSLAANNIYSNTITGAIANGYATPSDGAGVCLQTEYTGNNATVLALHYNRIRGNTGGSHTGLGVGCGAAFNGGGNATVATVSATDNWFGCNPSTATNGGAGNLSGAGCDSAGISNTSGPILNLSPYTVLTLTLNASSISAGSNVVATASLGQDSSGTVYASTASLNGVTYAPDAAYLATPITTFAISNTGTVSYNPSSTAFSSSANATVSYAAATATGAANATGTGTATVTVDGQTVTRTYTVVAPDLNVTSTHTGNFKAGDTGDIYTLTVGNVGTSSTSGTVTLIDTLPAGFTATAASGTGWSCNALPATTVTCTNSMTVAASVTFPALNITVSVSSSDAGTYTNNVSVSGGGEINTNNDTATDSTIVIATPTIAEGFSPTSVAPNVTSTLTFTLGNPSANSVSLTGVAFSDTFPTGLKIVTAATTTCTGGTATGAVNATAVSLSGATIAAGATCTVTAGVTSPSAGSYTNTTGNVTATNSNAGGTASATLTVVVTPTKLAFTSVPASPITAGGNAGTVSVALEDASNNVATGNSSTVVTLAVTAPTGYSQTYVATATNGVASFNLSSVPLTVASTYTYTATATGLTQAQVTETDNPGAFAALTVTGLATFTAPQQAGTATVKATDAYGNTVTSFTGTVTLSSTDAAATFAPASYTYAAADNGSHTFTVTFNTAGTQTVTATSGAITGSEPNILVEDAIWILSKVDSLTRITDAGVPTNSVGSTTGTSSIGAVAFDAAGNVWATQMDNDGFVKYSANGTFLTGASGIGGLSGPSAVYIDGLGQAWFTNTDSNSITLLSAAGTAISPATGYQPGTFGTPTGIIVDNSGSVWITNYSGNSIIKVFGAAAPATTPNAAATVNKTQGTRP